ncbi:MAG: hypothetical protein JWN34_39 [Bryobacterales bacterium]|nr:hypothetical protein [Bryobacterales bacterium]
MVEPKIQRLVWATYRPGQEVDKQPSHEYLLVQRSAVWQVFVDEGGCTWPDVPAIGTDAYMVGPSILSTEPRQAHLYRRCRMKDLTRREGVYCHWETYPEQQHGKDNILVIERVAGNGTVTTFDCAREEAATIVAFLAQAQPEAPVSGGAE